MGERMAGWGGGVLWLSVLVLCLGVCDAVKVSVPGAGGAVMDVGGLGSSWMLGAPVWDAAGEKAVAFGFDAGVSKVPTAANGLKVVQISWSASGGAVGVVEQGGEPAGAGMLGGAAEVSGSGGVDARGVGLMGDGSLGMVEVSTAADGTRVTAQVGDMGAASTASGCTMYAAGAGVGSVAYGMYATDCLAGNGNRVEVVVVDAATAAPSRSVMIKLNPAGWDLGPGQPAVLRTVLETTLQMYTPAPTAAPGTVSTTEQVEVQVVQHSLAFDYSGEPSDVSVEAVQGLEQAISAALGYEDNSMVKVVCICSGPCTSSCTMAGNARATRRVLLQTGGLYVDYQIDVSEGSSPGGAGTAPASMDTMKAMLESSSFLQNVTNFLAADPYFPAEAIQSPPVSARSPVEAKVVRTVTKEVGRQDPVVYTEPEELDSTPEDSLSANEPLNPQADAFLKYSGASSLHRGHVLWSGVATAALAWAA